MKKIYVGCALTHASSQFREEVEHFKNKLRKNWKVLDFIGLEKGTDADVFAHDTTCVRDCDLFVALCDHPSLGLGFELGLALEIGKPVLVAAAVESRVTRLILGIRSPNYTFVRYETLDALIPYINTRLEK